MKITGADDAAALRGLYAGGWDPPAAVVDAVRAILADVRARGDDALLEYTRRWDFADAAPDALRVAIPPPGEARRLIPAAIAGGLELARERAREKCIPRAVGRVIVDRFRKLAAVEV